MNNHPLEEAEGGLEMSTNDGITTTMRSLAERIAEIPDHPAVKASKNTLAITLDFTTKELIDTNFWRSQEYVNFHKTLISVLESHRSLSTRILVTVIFPNFRSQSTSAKECQKDLVKIVAGFANQVEKVEKVEVVFRSPETNWSQIQSLAPFYGLSFKDWKACIKEGGSNGKTILRGSEWDQKLRNLYRDLKSTGQL